MYSMIEIFGCQKTDSYLALLSINDHLLSDNQNDFRRKEVIDWLPQDLRNIAPGIISHRHLNWLIKIHVLRRQQDFYCRFGRPGRHGKNDKEILSGPKKFYSQSGFILYLQKLVHQITPRSIIYTVLRQSKMLERFLKLCEYKALLVVKNTDVDDMIKQTKMIIPFPELAFDRDKYLQQQKNSLKLQRNKKEILSMASNKAKLRLEKLDWSDRIYTRFFIAGYYQVVPGLS